jgi:hypothetical protein
MLKRNIAVLIAGALLSAQAGLAVAQSGPFPESAEQYQYWKPWGAQEKYFAERAARDPNPTGGPSPVFPPNRGAGFVSSPELEKYFAERAARGPITGAPGGVFIPVVDRAEIDRMTGESFNDGRVHNHPG